MPPFLFCQSLQFITLKCTTTRYFTLTFRANCVIYNQTAQDFVHQRHNLSTFQESWLRPRSGAEHRSTIGSSSHLHVHDGYSKMGHVLQVASFIFLFESCRSDDGFEDGCHAAVDPAGCHILQSLLFRVAHQFARQPLLPKTGSPRRQAAHVASDGGTSPQVHLFHEEIET